MLINLAAAAPHLTQRASGYSMRVRLARRVVALGTVLAAGCLAGGGSRAPSPLPDYSAPLTAAILAAPWESDGTLEALCRFCPEIFVEPALAYLKAPGFVVDPDRFPRAMTISQAVLDRVPTPKHRFIAKRTVGADPADSTRTVVRIGVLDRAPDHSVLTFYMFVIGGSVANAWIIINAVRHADAEWHVSVTSYETM
ncbi:hypothetical protein YTPLAS18_40390 [Nitrospira sp.]|nr:hypothetical protein YTPLAS18_40390 [Nitrospira sp.]